MGRPAKDIRIKRRTDVDGRFMVMFTEDPTHWHTISARDEKDALAYAKRNRDILIATSSLRFDDLVKDFFAVDGVWANRMRAKGHSYVDKYLETRQGHLDNYILKEFGDRDPRDITRREVDNWLMSLGRASGDSKPLAGATRNKILYTMSIVFEELMDRGLIDTNVITGIRPYNKTPVHPRGVLPIDAIEKLFPATHGSLIRVWGSSMWSACMLVLFDTGMRPGEARALTWGDLHKEIDFATKQSSWAFVVRNAIESGTMAKIKSTKNDMVKAGGISIRTVNELLAWREETRFPNDSDFIFTISGKAPVTGAGIVAAFRRGMRGVGLNEEGWTPYWLRHTFVTRALKVLSPQDIASLAGHSVEVSRMYQHPDDEIVLAKTKAARDALVKTRNV